MTTASSTSNKDVTTSASQTSIKMTGGKVKAASSSSFTTTGNTIAIVAVSNNANIVKKNATPTKSITVASGSNVVSLNVPATPATSNISATTISSTLTTSMVIYLFIFKTKYILNHYPT